jgi:hypothetical protein
MRKIKDREVNVKFDNNFGTLRPVLAAVSSVDNNHGTLRPVLASINAARQYMGSPSKAKFYADLLPLLETVKFRDTDKRRWVVVSSMDRLIDERRAATAEIRAAGHASPKTGSPSNLDQQLSDYDPMARRPANDPRVGRRRNG